ncbi:MAG: NADP-dependent phosphogluconate dehydrogenase, partial [Cyclobacteriaceae bacterium]
LLDKAKQKGTGKWTSQDAMNLGVPIPTIDAAVSMRALSSLKADRVAADKAYNLNDNIPISTDKQAMVKMVEGALHVAFITAYAQGMHMLYEASKEYGYGTDLEAVARIWRGGCIIRASLLEDIRKAYDAEPNLQNLLQSDVFVQKVVADYPAIKEFIELAANKGLPSMAFGASFNYLGAFITDRLPLNVVQAQRDYFGSHTYERTDREGIFHTEWER